MWTSRALRAFGSRTERQQPWQVLVKLKSRLFDLSRRNKLLHFRDTGGFVNLTVASVPPLLDHKSIDLVRSSPGTRVCRTSSSGRRSWCSPATST